MKIAVASGKGGTGKSTVSINLAYLLSKTYKDVCLLDCDVEEPNCHIFLNPCINKSEHVFMPVPEVNDSKCISCQKCAQICEFNALAFVKNFVIVFPELCHGCGGCRLICPAGAITETGREIGTVEAGIGYGFNFIYGKLRIGEAMSPPLIKAVKKEAENFKFQVLDCPPGTSCPVISSIDDADFVILVTEPTPFGLYDLKLAIEVVRKLNLPLGIVINKSGENDGLIENHALSEGIKVLTKIPDDRRIAECYSRGKIILRELPEYRKNFEPLIQITREILSDKLFGVQK
ncbi:MAG: (4Fe-4S)-binding protein [Candidatus Melainabacteria bacterium RIFOXYA12_FULL_32_12]|nr:MAG: (4Fe-4S)-binding protein [Candidatus Melainabacteria bacterium RIFOXYA12_FULL_32_12]